jgi:AcrR family transcriptional regulator
VGLRERKKQETRQALSDAALRLAVERGLDNVLVEEIAAAANVSPRTFNNYFSSKQEAIVWRVIQRTTGLAELLSSRPAEEPLWTALTEAAVEQHGGTTAPSPDWQRGVRLMLETPSLQGELLKSYHAPERELTAAIAKRTGVDPERDMMPQLVAGSVSLAIRVASERWLTAKPAVPFEPLLREALAQISAGLHKEPS